MKLIIKYSYQYLFTFLIPVLLFSACKKSETPITNNFTWTFKGATHTAVFNKAFIASMAGKPIIIGNTNASSTPSTNSISFTVSSFNTGSYNLSPGGNVLYYNDEVGNNLGITSGTLNITSSNNNLLSGNFSATLIDILSVTRPISGSFTNVTIEP